MSKFLRFLTVLILLVGLVSGAFALYSSFLVDYSLESLEVALTASDQNLGNSSELGANVYQKLLQGLALEQAADDPESIKDLSMLELAARSFDEASDRAGTKRAKMYLSQTEKTKVPARGQALQIADVLYRYLQEILYYGLNFLRYIHPQKTEKDKAQGEVSSYLILTQADEKERKWQFDEAAELYRKFLEFYPGHPDGGFASLSLAQVLMKQRKYYEAERVLKKVVFDYSGLGEYQLALVMLKKVESCKKRERSLLEAEKRLAGLSDGRDADLFRLRVALEHLSMYSFDKAQEFLKELQESKAQDIRVKAKFYLGLVYKLQSQFDQGAEILSELSKESGLHRDLELGIEAQLADIYYQGFDAEKSLEHYRKISESVSNLKVQEGDAPSALGAWSALADAEQAVIYYFDLGDPQKAQDSLNRLNSSLGEFSELADLRSALAQAAAADLRDLAFEQLKRGRVYESMKLFKKKVRQSPDDAWSHSGLATAYVLLTDLYLAEESARTGEAKRSDAYTNTVLGYVLAYQGRLSEAVERYQQALGMGPGYIPAEYNLAGIYLVQKKYREALELLEDLDEQFQDHRNLMKSKILNNRGYARWHLGDKKAALADFKQAVSMTPGFKDAENNLTYAESGKDPQTISLGMK